MEFDVQTRVVRLVESAVERLATRGGLRERYAVQVTRSRSDQHGDFSTGLALSVAKREGRPPRAIAEALAAELSGAADVASVEVAGPGFVNVRLHPEVWVGALDAVLSAGDRYGWSAAERDEPPVLVEFVSANPTGPLHVGHGRGAVVGDVLVRLFRACGVPVAAEYYWNDRGRQVRELGESIAIRLRERVLGEAPPSAESSWYRGDYVKVLSEGVVSSAEFAGEAAADGADAARAIAALDRGDPRFTAYGTARLQEAILATLARLRVSFDRQESERRVAADIERFAEGLRERGLVVAEDGALFLRTAGREKEDKNRVIRKSDGEWTYFATDLMYHADKLRRGFGRMIDIWGADHHGYVPRMRAGLAALEHSPEALEVLLVQMVNLTSGGQPVRMSKRSGEFVTLDELMDEVGVDAARYLFLTRRHDSQLDFDVELAKKRSLDNPVFYAQYGHARLSAILRRAEALRGDSRLPESARRALDGGFGTPGAQPPPHGALDLPEEVALARLTLALPAVLSEAAAAREPHRVVYFVQELSQAFQRYYTERWKRHGDPILPPARIDADGLAAWNWEKTAARLRWVRALRAAQRSALAVAGVEAPERMTWGDDPDEEEVAGSADEAAGFGGTGSGAGGDRREGGG
jgi:arginyl-tRNA synthetase